MSHEIEANFIAEWPDGEKRCERCSSFFIDQGRCFCAEAKAEVPPQGHCDFFQSLV
jgi:hypothetical protein